LHFLISGPGWWTEAAADAWVRWVVERKGDQHPPARRPILAIVRGYQLDLEQGEELAVVSRILGHASITTTANV
jgi:hypothetical protein